MGRGGGRPHLNMHAGDDIGPAARDTPRGMMIHHTTFGLPRHPPEPSSDACGVTVHPDHVIAVLADGAGTGSAAREAAQRAVEMIGTHYASRPAAWTPDRALHEIVLLLNRTFCSESEARFDRREMVSTLAVAVIEGDTLYGLNAGDSRVWLFRGGQLEQLSEDHVDPDDPNCLVSGLGITDTPVLHTFRRTLTDGDMLLLCSDGVWKHQAEAELLAALQCHASARSIVGSARAAATAETLDDMSAIVVDVRQVSRLRAREQRALPVLNELRKGMAIDGWVLQRSFGESDRCWLAENDTQRAVLKFPPADAAQDDTLLNAFIRETWNATRIDADWFVRATVPDHATARYYFMEFIDAPSLKTLLRSRRLAVDEAVELGKFLAAGCQYLLRHDLIHGDLKPDNILADSNYDRLRFKLVDLGSTVPVFSTVSRAGTASYLAPERFIGAPVSERTEIFAIGVTLYEALTGRLPFGEIERFQTPHFSTPKPPSSINRNLPDWLNSVILRACALQPSQRYQHYSEIAFDLANPDKVQPWHTPGAPLLQTNPLLFYKAGFFVLLVTVVLLLLKMAGALRGLGRRPSGRPLPHALRSCRADHLLRNVRCHRRVVPRLCPRRPAHPFALLFQVPRSGRHRPQSKTPAGRPQRGHRSRQKRRDRHRPRKGRRK